MEEEELDTIIYSEKLYLKPRVPVNTQNGKFRSCCSAWLEILNSDYEHASLLSPKHDIIWCLPALYPKCSPTQSSTSHGGTCCGGFVDKT